jgi:hypothetical protein
MKVRHRGHGEDGIYLDVARNRYMGAVSLGFGPDGKRIRRKVSGKTKQEVRDRLKALHQEMDAGVRSSSTYTVREAGAGGGEADPAVHGEKPRSARLRMPGPKLSCSWSARAFSPSW